MSKKASSTNNVYNLVSDAKPNIQDLKRVQTHPYQYSDHWKNTGSNWKKK
jgi:hypothetical protein